MRIDTNRKLETVKEISGWKSEKHIYLYLLGLLVFQQANWSENDYHLQVDNLVGINVFFEIEWVINGSVTP